MTNKNLMEEIKLVSTMKQYNLTLTEAEEAMRLFADDKQFQKDLDSTMNNQVLDDWDYWYDNDIT